MAGKTYVVGTEPVKQDKVETGISGTTHQRKTSKESAHERIKALRAGLKES